MAETFECPRRYNLATAHNAPDTNWIFVDYFTNLPEVAIGTNLDAIDLMPLPVDTRFEISITCALFSFILSNRSLKLIKVHFEPPFVALAFFLLFAILPVQLNTAM